MKVIEKGHVYDVPVFDGAPNEASRITYVNREKGTEHPGTRSQPVLAALIDRTLRCDACLRWPGNDQIIFHLRSALLLHEIRALLRKHEKGPPYQGRGDRLTGTDSKSVPDVPEGK